MYSKTWYKAIDNKLDRKDVELLNLLLKDRSFSQEELNEFSKKLDITLDEVKKRIETLKQKNIILKTRSSVINPIKVWNNYVYVLVKAALKPPIVGMDIEFPTGWSDMMKRIIKFQHEKKVNIIRIAHALHGIGGWDLLFILTFNNMDVFLEMLETLNKEGWITKAESFRPNEYKDLYIFDPMSAPTPEEFDDQVTKQIKEFEKVSNIGVKYKSK